MAQDPASYYMSLLQQGMPAAQAFKMAWPNGIPTAADRQKMLAAAQQKQNYGQIGGLLIGALGSKAVFDAVTGKGMFAQGGLFGPKAAEAVAQTAQQSGISLSSSSLGSSGAAGTSAAPFSSAVDQSIDLAPGAATDGAGAGYSLGSGDAATGGATAGEAGSTMASVTPYLGLVGAGLGAYGMAQGINAGSRKESAIGGAGLGAGLGAALPLLGFTALGPGGLLLAALGGGAAGAMMGHIKTGKSQVQQQRDSIRGGYQQAGIADPNYNVRLADGSQFNIGLDGKNMFQSADGSEHHAYDTDMSNPLSAIAIPGLNPLVQQMLGPKATQKQLSDGIGMLSNAVMSNAKDPQSLIANINALYQHAGMQPPQLGGIKPQAAPVGPQQPQQPQMPQQPPPQGWQLQNTPYQKKVIQQNGGFMGPMINQVYGGGQ